MTLQEALKKLKTLPEEKKIDEFLRTPLVSPKLDEDIKRFLHDRSRSKNYDDVKVWLYSSNNKYSIIWIHIYGGTHQDYLVEEG